VSTLTNDELIREADKEPRAVFVFCVGCTSL
jgi:hypothetical protein